MVTGQGLECQKSPAFQLVDTNKRQQHTLDPHSPSPIPGHPHQRYSVTISSWRRSHASETHSQTDRMNPRRSKRAAHRSLAGGGRSGSWRRGSFFGRKRGGWHAMRQTVGSKQWIVRQSGRGFDFGRGGWNVCMYACMYVLSRRRVTMKAFQYSRHAWIVITRSGPKVIHRE